MKGSKIIVSAAIVAGLTVAAAQFASAARQPEKAPATKGGKPANGHTGAQPDKAKPAGQPAGQPGMEEMMAMMHEAAKTGPQHAELAKSVGTWDCAMTFWMPGADGKPTEMKSKGEAKFTAELDGRWIRQDFKGDFMGTPFVGIGQTGYDNLEQKFVTTWRDTMSTSVMVMHGTWDAASKTMTYTGEATCAPGMKAKHRHTLLHKDDNTSIFTMYQTMPGAPEEKGMEIVYTRRK